MIIRTKRSRRLAQGASEAVFTVGTFTNYSTSDYNGFRPNPGAAMFVRVTPPDVTDPQRLYDPARFDFRLKAGSAAVDAGVALPNITGGFTGRAPDLGAYELDRPLPV